MLWTVIKAHYPSMPLAFESMNAKDAEGIVQAWADKRHLGKLAFQWKDTNNCFCFFRQRGVDQLFMKMERKHS